jgi:hypothetical protein
MTRDFIILLAEEWGIAEFENNESQADNILHFAAIVAAVEREACAKVCEEKTAYQMQIPCPDGIPGCLVFHAIEAKREKTGSECAAAIRARGSK